MYAHLLIIAIRGARAQGDVCLLTSCCTTVADVHLEQGAGEQRAHMNHADAKRAHMNHASEASASFAFVFVKTSHRDVWSRRVRVPSAHSFSITACAAKHGSNLKIQNPGPGATLIN
jgi:hypothetical protein